MDFRQQFTIHPVGQGLFYSCLIQHNHQVKFRMVFDCGSLTKNAGEEEVDIYRDDDFLKVKTLDLLVISHFDADHVKHIGRLLADNIKVKKLVMPLITFSERLFLVARYIEDNNGLGINDNFIVNFIIDPLGTISDNLDGDAEVFLIDRDDRPIPPDEENTNESNDRVNDQQRFVFDFDKKSKEAIDASAIQTTKPNAKLYKIKDSAKGKLLSNGVERLMDFLFYKRSVGKEELEFFNTVSKKFFEKYSIDGSLPLEELLAEITKHIRTLTSATEIKKIFTSAKEESGLDTFKGIKIADLNTTALCMLHRNLLDILDFLGYPAKSNPDLNFIWDCLNRRDITYIQKFSSPEGSRIKTQNFFDRYPYPDYLDVTNRYKFIYPNALLTSDSFLLTQEQVDEFVSHYRNYWDDYWLFQIPHHGSQKSSNGILHSLIPIKPNCFVNYGLGNKDDHPDASVIQSLVVTGQSLKLISINQISGIRFNLDI